MNNTMSAATAKNNNPSQTQQSTGKSMWSPFDEKEEWNKISKIIDSFGADIGASVKASTTPNNCKCLKRNLEIF